MATELKKTIKPSGQGGDYTTLSAAIVANGQNLVTADKYLLFEIGGDWTGVVDTAEAMIESDAFYTSDATRYIKIYTTGAARHNGIYGNKASAYKLEVVYSTGSLGCVGCTDGDVCGLWIDGLQLKYTATNNLPWGPILYNADPTNSGAEIKISNNICDCVFSGFAATNDNAIAFNSSGGTSFAIKIWNNICYESLGNKLGYGFFLSSSGSGTIYAYNNTLWGFDTGISQNGASLTVIAKNNMVQNGAGGVKDFSGTFSSSSTGNLSSDESAPAYGSYYRSKTVTFKGGFNFLLRSDDAQARGRGVNLYNDANIAVTDDIVGTARDGWVWDIGAHQSSVVYCPNGYNNGLTADEFSNQSLESFWTWDAGVSGSYTENSSGNLVITSGTGGPSPYPETITKMYQTATDDFDVWTKMSWDTFTVDMQECGLEIGAPSFTSPFGSSCSLFAARISGTKYLWYCHVVDGTEYDSADIFTFTGTTIWLRIKRVGESFTAYYATSEPTTGGWTKLANPSTTWRKGGSVPVTLMAITNGGGTTFNATFEYFRLSSGTAFINDEIDDSSIGSYWTQDAGTGGSFSEDTSDLQVTAGTGNVEDDPTWAYQTGITGDFDIWTKLVTSANLASNTQYTGLRIQDSAGNSLVIGPYYNTGFMVARFEYFLYSGTYSYEYVATSSTAGTTWWVRVKRVGPSIYCYITNTQPYQDNDWQRAVSAFSAYPEFYGNQIHTLQTSGAVDIGLFANRIGGNAFSTKFAFAKNWIEDVNLTDDYFSDGVIGEEWTWVAGTSGTHSETAPSSDNFNGGTGYLDTRSGWVHTKTTSAGTDTDNVVACTNNELQFNANTSTVCYASYATQPTTVEQFVQVDAKVSGTIPTDTPVLGIYCRGPGSGALSSIYGLLVYKASSDNSYWIGWTKDGGSTTNSTELNGTVTGGVFDATTYHTYRLEVYGTVTYVSLKIYVDGVCVAGWVDTSSLITSIGYCGLLFEGNEASYTLYYDNFSCGDTIHLINAGTGNISTDPTWMYQTVTGDFDIKCMVRCNPTANYQAAGLRVQVDANNCIMLHRWYTGGTNQIRYVHRVASTNYAVTFNTTNQTVWLRIRRVNGVFTAYYSIHDPCSSGIYVYAGYPWTLMSQPGTTLTNKDTVTAGIQANTEGGASIPAYFYWCKNSAWNMFDTVGPSSGSVQGNFTTLLACFNNGAIDLVLIDWNYTIYIQGDWTGSSETHTTGGCNSGDYPTDKFHWLKIIGRGDARVSKAQYQATGKPYRLEITIDTDGAGHMMVQGDYAQVDGIQIKFTAANRNNSAGLYFNQITDSSARGKALLSNCIIKGALSGTSGATSPLQMIYTASDVSNYHRLWVWNCILQDWVNGTNANYVFTDNYQQVVNCLLHNNRYGYFANSIAAVRFTNCIGYGNYRTYGCAASSDYGPQGSNNVVDDGATDGSFGLRGEIVTQGVNTSTQASHLKDSGNSFSGVEVGMIVVCMGNAFAYVRPTYVTAVAANDLTLNDDLFTSSPYAYMIFKSWHKTPTFADAANDDFTLSSSDTSCINKAIDCSADGFIAFTTDIIGTTR